MRWPRCGFRFFSRYDKDHWRICEEPWGHWLFRGERGTHAGPTVARRASNSFR